MTLLNRATLALLVAASTCVDAAVRVFVPGEGYAESIRVWTDQGDSATVRVGDPLVLHADRRSGPWVEVDRGSLAEDACWLASPVDVEAEVSGSLRWIAEPAEPAVFNVDLRLDGTREVRFNRPGVYTLRAQSSGWCSAPYYGPVLRVVVGAR